MTTRQDRSFWLLVSGNVLMVAGIALSFPFFAIYLTVHRGLPAGWVGAFLSASMLATALAQGIGGEWSDAIGRKKVMLVSLAGRTVTTGLMAWAMWTGQHYGWLLALHMAGMFIGSFFGPASKGWVADTCPPERRVRAYGFIRMGINLGWAVGPAIGGMLALKSYPLMFLLTSLAYAGGGLLLAFGLKDSPLSGNTEPRRLADFLSTLRDRRFALLCLYSLLIASVMSQLVVSLSLHCVRFLDLTERNVGLLFSLNGALVVALQYWVSGMVERRSLSSGLAVGCLFYGAGYLWLGFSGGLATAAAAVAVLTLGEVVVAPGMQTMAANLAPEKRKGRYLGMHGILQQAGAAMGIMLGGLGNEFVAPLWAPGPWCAVAVIAVMASAGFYSMGRMRLPEDGAVEEPTPKRLQPV